MNSYRENDGVIYSDQEGRQIDTFVLFDTDCVTGLTHINHNNLKVPGNQLKPHPKAIPGCHLPKLSGNDFDKDYVAVMIEGHKKTLALMQNEASNGKDADFKAFAAKTAPIVQMHLDAINKISANMK